MFWIIAIAIGVMLYFVFLLFFFSLLHASKRGDEILSDNELMDTKQFPKPPSPSEIVGEAKEIIKKISNRNKNQNPPMDYPDI